MALSASKLSTSPIVPDRTSICKPRGASYSVPNSPQHSLHQTIQGVDHKRQNSGRYLKGRSSLYGDGLWCLCRRPFSYIIARGSSLLCHATRTQRTESKESVKYSDHCSDVSREFCEDEDDGHLVAPGKVIYLPHGLAEACKYVCNDAKYVNERARNDIVLLSRGILSLDARARQDVAFLGSEFLKLDARARKDTGKIDHNVKKKAERLYHITTILKEKAKSRLKSAADRHWSDGALEADLRRADFVAKRRAMEDTLMALELLKNIHDMMVGNMCKIPLRMKNGLSSANIMLEKNGKSLDFFPTEVSNDRITAIQEAYWSMASALSEADGIDYTDPEELELLVTTLLDLDAMDGKSSATLLAECSSSPDVNTRRALANALAAAPSMWTLGNAGMGALQRLAEDSNPAVASAASRAIHELKKQWEIEECDSWRFMMNQKPLQEADDNADDGADD